MRGPWKPSSGGTTWEHLELLGLILDLAPSPIFAVRRNGKIAWQNYAFHLLTGYRPREIRAFAGYLECLRPRDLAGQPLLLDPCWSRERPLSYGELRVLVKADREVVVDLAAFPIMEDTGQAGGALVFLQDRTAEASLQGKLSSREKLTGHLERVARVFEMLVEAMPDSLLVTDAAGTVNYVNPMLARTIGLPLPRIRGAPIERFLQPATRPKAKQGGPPESPIPSQGSVRIMALVRSDGSRCFVAVSATALADRDGSVFGTMYICQDLTEIRRRMKAEARLDSTHPADAAAGAETRPCQQDDRLERVSALFTTRIEEMRAIVAASRLERRRLIEVFVDEIEQSSPERRGHSGRVARLAGSIGRELFLPPEQIERIEDAARLHHVARPEIRDRLGLGPEIEEMLANHGVDFHPTPTRIDEPSLGARILRVADGIDTFLRRPVVEDPESARAHLATHRGSLYDPEVVDAALECLEYLE